MLSCSFFGFFFHFFPIEKEECFEKKDATNKEGLLHWSSACVRAFRKQNANTNLGGILKLVGGLVSFILTNGDVVFF